MMNLYTQLAVIAAVTNRPKRRDVSATHKWRGMRHEARYRDAFGGQIKTSHQIAKVLGISNIGCNKSLFAFEKEGKIERVGRKPRPKGHVGQPEILWRWIV